MLAELYSYHLTDFILFSKSIYLDLLESYQAQSFWLLIAVSLINTYCILNIHRKSFFQKFWLMISVYQIALAFGFYRSYLSSITWHWVYFFYALLIQSALLMILLLRNSDSIKSIDFSPANKFLILLLMILPFEMIFAQSINTSLILFFGVGPTSTSLVTLVFILLCFKGYKRVILSIIPLLLTLANLVMWYGLSIR